MTRLLCFALIAFALPICAHAAARPSEAGACRVLSPRYEPKLRAQVETPARFQGGARLTLPVAAPCPRKSGAQDA